MPGTDNLLNTKLTQKRLKARYVYNLITDGSEEGHQLLKIILGLGAGSALATMGVLLSIYEFSQGNYFRGLSELGITQGLSFFAIQIIAGHPHDPDPIINRNPRL